MGVVDRMSASARKGVAFVAPAGAGGAGLGQAVSEALLEPIYFGDPSAPLFGVLNWPTSANRGDRGVLICAPLGYENVIYYRQLAVLGGRLAALGRPTLRFDWPGVGDSAGDDHLPGLVAAYLDSVDVAANELRERAAVEHVDVVGLRVGALLAAAAASAGAAVSDLVLWDPFPSGRGYLRAVRAFEGLSKSAAKAENEPGGGQPASGFVIAPSTAADLQEIDLTELEFGSRRRVLLAGRDGPPDKLLVETFASLGHDVTPAAFEGLREVALGWVERPVPVESFETIESWLAPVAPRDQPARERSTESAATFDVNGVSVEEHAIVSDDPARTLGIVTMPADREAADSWVVFVPNRYARRIGPNRLYTNWARAWAAAGVASIRIDVNGTGDADGPDEETDRDMYQPEGIADALQAVSHLRDRYGARRFALMGLCSGAYISFHAALADPSIAVAVLLNPQMLLWTDQETAVSRAGILGTRMRRLSSWRWLFAHPVMWRRTVLPTARNAVAEYMRFRTTTLLARNGERPVTSFIRDALARLDARRCRVLFVFSAGDAGIAYLERHLGAELRGLTDRSCVRVEVVPDADHSFRSVGRQAVLRELVEGQLVSAGFDVVTPSV